MVNSENIEDFINYNFTPFAKSQCIRRVLIIWAISISVGVIGRNNRSWLVVIGCISAAVSLLFVYLLVAASLTRNARFLCDGVSYAYISVLLCIAAYRVIAFQIGGSGLLLIVLLGLWLISISLYTLLVFLNIKHGKYGNVPQKQNAVLLPFAGGLLGMGVVRLFLSDISQKTAIFLLSAILLLLSLLSSVGSVNLLKAILAKKIGTE